MERVIERKIIIGPAGGTEVRLSARFFPRNGVDSWLASINWASLIQSALSPSWESLFDSSPLDKFNIHASMYPSQ